MVNRATLEQAEIAARKLARVIKENTPEGWGFVVVLMSFGEGGMSTYLSSIEREGCITALRELADKLEANETNI